MKNFRGHMVMIIVVFVALVGFFAIGCSSTSSVAQGTLVMAGADGTFKDTTKKTPSQSIDALGPNEVYEIDSAIYASVIEDMENQLDRYLGKSVGIEGAVFRLDHFPANEFIVARMLVTCCITDALLTGILVRSEDAHLYVTDSWVRVTGTIESTMYHDVWRERTSEVALLNADAITQIEKPSAIYIYP